MVIIEYFGLNRQDEIMVIMVGIIENTAIRRWICRIWLAFNILSPKFATAPKSEVSGLIKVPVKTFIVLRHLDCAQLARFNESRRQGLH